MGSDTLLRALIREIASEQSSAKPRQVGKIWLAGREITGGLKFGYHSWIIVWDPRDPPSTFKTYSGKSGVGFEIGLASAAANKLVMGKTRDELADALLKLRDFELNSKEYREALAQTTWGPLLKLKNWDSDHPSKADERFELYPLVTYNIPKSNAPPTSSSAIAPVTLNISQERDPYTHNAIQICDNLERAFNNYTQNVPYDPHPSLSSNSEKVRNSNSFTYTLARIVNPKMPITGPAGFQPRKYPGWGLEVPGLSP